MIREYMEKFLVPRIQGDGGWVEFVSLEGDQLTLAFRGECSKCDILDRCADWIAEKIRQDLDQSVRVIPLRKKPYFIDR